MADREREEAALDALIVLALRNNPDDEAAVLAMLSGPDELPELTEAEKAALEKIDIEAIIERANRREG